MTNNVRGLSARYACAELLWYLNEMGPLDMIKHYAPSYVNYAEANGIVWGAYGRRIATQLPHIIQELKDQHSRRAVIALYLENDIRAAREGKKDIPCTLNWNFLFNERNELCLIATMRSNDAWLGMPYDIWVNTRIQLLVANLLGVKMGWYQHQVANLHLYAVNWKKAERAINGAVFDTSREVWNPVECYSEIPNAIAAEEAYREHGRIIPAPERSWLRDICHVLRHQLSSISSLNCNLR